MQSTSDQLIGLKLDSEQQILSKDRWLLKDYPLERYLSFYDDLPGYPGYSFVPEMADEICTAIEARVGLEAVEAYNRLAMLRLISEAETHLQNKKLTAGIRSLIFDYHDRILKDMAAPRKGFYLHSNDRFAKDFAVCRLKLLPCGAELVDPRSGVARSILKKGGIGQLLSGLRLFCFRLGGFKPYYQIHFDQRLVGGFNEEGYTQLYLRLADLLELNPSIKGIMSGSWWHDPQLAEISPELGFIGKWPESSGAELLLVGSFDDATVDATRFSATRTKLYKEGTYKPQVYLMIWGRDDMLAWAKDYRSRFPQSPSDGFIGVEPKPALDGTLP
jgi:hypothetical protein